MDRPQPEFAQKDKTEGGGGIFSTVPVTQLVVASTSNLGAYGVLAALAMLAAEDVLIIGSGHMTHNLRERRSDGPLPYAVEFQEWVREKIEARDLDALVDYRAFNPHGVRAHPSDEQFLPLFVALGAAGANYRAERLHAGIKMGSLAMDAYRFS